MNAGRKVTGGRVYEIAPPSLRTYVSEDTPQAFKPVEKALKGAWRFPPFSVSVVEIETAADES